MRRFLLARIAAVRRKGAIERLAIDILRVRRQMRLHRRRKLAVGPVRQGRSLYVGGNSLSETIIFSFN